MKRSTTHTAAIFAIVFLGVSQLHLSGADDHAGSLRLDYWTYGVSGDATVDNTSTDIKDSNKVINGNNRGFILGGERSFENWGLNLDVFLGKQSSSKQISDSESVDWDSEFSILSGGAYLNFLNKEFEGSERNLRVDGLAGFRGYMNAYTIQHNPFDPVNDENRTVYANWVDSYLGLRLKAQLTQALALQLYGDAGGFGIGSGSELSILTHADVVWTVTDGLDLIGGYRLFDLDATNHVVDHKTKVDLQMAGLTFGVQGRF